jgi:hypothetical protein
MATKPFVIVPSIISIAVAYSQAGLIADGVFPRVPVLTEAFRYLKYNIADSFNAPDTRVGRKGKPNELEFGSTEVTDQVFDEALDFPVPNADIEAWQRASAAASGPTALVGMVDPLMNGAELVMQAVANRREFRAATLATTLANYAVPNRQTLAGVTQWSDYVNSDPIRAIMDAFDSMIMRPNIGWMGQRVATVLRQHPRICKAVFGNNTDAGIVPIRALADLLELEQIYVGNARVNTAKPGQAPVLNRCWGLDAGFCYRNMSANTRGGVTFGMTAEYGDKIGGTIEDADIGARGGQRVRTGESVKELITANDLGYLFKNAVAA